jgi:hypothetical protein
MWRCCALAELGAAGRGSRPLWRLQLSRVRLRAVGHCCRAPCAQGPTARQYGGPPCAGGTRAAGACMGKVAMGAASTLTGSVCSTPASAPSCVPATGTAGSTGSASVGAGPHSLPACLPAPWLPSRSLLALSPTSVCGSCGSAHCRVASLSVRVRVSVCVSVCVRELCQKAHLPRHSGAAGQAVAAEQAQQHIRTVSPPGSGLGTRPVALMQCRATHVGK